MLTMIGRRTTLASVLRRKLGSAASTQSSATRDVATSGMRVRFRVNRQHAEERILSWEPQKHADDVHLSLLSPRGLALLGLGAGETIAYRKASGRTEFFEIEEVFAAEHQTPSPTRQLRRCATSSTSRPLTLPRRTAPFQEASMPETRKDGFSSYWTIVRLMERGGNHLRRALRRWQARRTATALEMLDDDVLRDIGITRAEIPSVALRVTAPATPTARHLSLSHPISAKEVMT